MAPSAGPYSSIDRHVAVNLRTYREAGHLSQEELAQRMTDRGFGFSQATVWKIEHGQRPVKVSELVALASALDILSPISLTHEPAAARHQAQLRQANHRALAAYGTLKDAAAGYLDAQMEALVMAREAHDAAVTLTVLDTSWLTIPAEQAVIEARIETFQADQQAEHVDGEVRKILDALRAADYQGTWNIEDVQVIPAGSPPAGPPSAADAPQMGT